MKWYYNRDLEGHQVSYFLNRLNDKGVKPEHIKFDSFGTLHYYAEAPIPYS